MLSLGSEKMNQYSGWEHTLFYMKKLYLKKKGNSLEATVTELKVACFKVIGRRWGGFLFLFFAFASVQWFYLVLEEPSPPQNCSKKKKSVLSEAQVKVQRRESKKPLAG